MSRFLLLVDRHPAKSFVLFLVAGFLAGWFAYQAVQFIFGVTMIEGDKLKILESPDFQEKEKLIENIENLKHKNSALRGYIDENHRSGKNYIRDIELFPPSPSRIKSGDKITAKFFYVTEGSKIQIVGGGNTIYEGSEMLLGEGVATRYVYSKEPCRLKMLVVQMIGRDGAVLYQMRIPVDYIIG